MYACLTGNVRWFDTLFAVTNLSDIGPLRTRYNKTLYHLVCTLPVPGYIGDEPINRVNKVPERLQILNTLFTTNIDMNVLTNTTQQTAFDIVATDHEKGYVANGDQKPLIRWWLEHSSDDRFDTGNRNRSLPWFAYFNRLEDVQRLCRMDSTDLNTETEYGRTALTLASGAGHTMIVKELLTYYPRRLTNLNHQDNDGSTALYTACRNNHPAIATILCLHPDVDLNIAGQFNRTVLIVVAGQGLTSLVKKLIGYYPHRLTDLNHQDVDGCTALYCACINNRLEIVKLLCRHPDVDLNLGYIGASPLIVAAEDGNKELMEILLQYVPERVNVQQRRADGATALRIALRKNNTEMVDMLRRYR